MRRSPYPVVHLAPPAQGLAAPRDAGGPAGRAYRHDHINKSARLGGGGHGRPWVGPKSRSGTGSTGGPT